MFNSHRRHHFPLASSESCRPSRSFTRPRRPGRWWWRGPGGGSGRPAIWRRRWRSGGRSSGFRRSPPRRRHGMHHAADRGVEDRGGPAALDAADRIGVVLARRAAIDHPAAGDLGEREAVDHGDRRRRRSAVALRFQAGEAIEFTQPRPGRAGIAPGVASPAGRILVHGSGTVWAWLTGPWPAPWSGAVRIAR